MDRQANVSSCGSHAAIDRAAVARDGASTVAYMMIAAIVFAFCPFFSVSTTRAAQEAQPAAARAPATDAALLQLARDPQAEATLRRDAVASVMDHGSDEAVQSLLEELKSTMDPLLRRVIVLGLRAAAKSPPGAADAMLLIARDLETSLLEDAGEVAGRGLDAGRFETFSALAVDRKAHVNSRLIATVALGRQRTQASAQALLALLEPGNAAPVRAAAFASLARLTGIDDHGADRDRWLAWWAQARTLSPADWQNQLLANFARRSETLARQKAALQERLVIAMRQRYRAVSKEDREGVLISMLNDPLDAIRELSLDLVREIVSSEAVGQTLITSLLTRLDDTSPAVRANATLLLRDLKSSDAADTIARRLAEEVEHDRAVLRAYLLMMKRQPRLAAIGPAITLLADPVVRAEAAGALLASFDNEPPLVGLEQSQRVAEFLRIQLAMEATPEPRFVELLGRVGNQTDFKQILRWLDHDVDAVKEAAARTWAASNRSLAPLAQRAGDPIIQAIVIPAATQRGEHGETLLALVEHRPKTEQIAVAWGRALVAMASRVDPDAVVAADLKLKVSPELDDLRLQILSAAISPLLLRAAAASGDVVAGNLSGRQFFTLQLMDLLHARAEVRIKSGDGKAALADLDRVLQLNIDLPARQQHRHDLIVIHARILIGELDEAFVKVGKYLTPEPPVESDLLMREKVIDLLLQCADQCATAKQTERAGQIVSRLRARLIRPVPLRLETRVAVVEERIRMTAARP